MSKWMGVALAALLAGAFVAVPAQASKVTQPQPGVLHVYDEGKFFSTEGIEKAKTALSGTRFARVTDVVMTNAPSVRLLDNVEDIARTLRVGRIFREVDDETAVRQLYEIAELDPRPGERRQRFYFSIGQAF